MTEAEWLACADPTPMLEFLRGKVSDRRLRLLDIACEIAGNNGQSSSYTPAFERHADGIATEEDNWLLGNDWTPAWESARLALRHLGCDSGDRRVRDIFGNPFRPVAVDPSWLTSTVVQLARGIYDERAFDRLPILADALQDAGCENAEVLEHCRGPGPHVRGCWVVDSLLGKA